MTSRSTKGKRRKQGTGGRRVGMSRHSGLEGEAADALDAVGEVLFPGATDPGQLDPTSRKSWVTIRRSWLHAFRGAADLAQAATEDIKRRTDLEAEDLRARRRAEIEHRAERGKAEEARAVAGQGLEEEQRKADLEDQAQRRREREALVELDTQERQARLAQEIKERETRRRMYGLLVATTVLTVLATVVLALSGSMSGAAAAYPGGALLSVLAMLRLFFPWPRAPLARRERTAIE
jgi:hypothetical protein